MTAVRVPRRGDAGRADLALRRAGIVLQIVHGRHRLCGHQHQRARNVILFVGDGMGVSTVTAARILDGQLRGEPGEENLLSFERLPYLALAKTYNTNAQVPDSAGTMTAMMSGVKNKAGMINISSEGLRADCASSKGNELNTFLDLMEITGRSTGVVSTARITHATPAATYSRVPERNWESDDGLTEAL